MRPEDRVRRKQTNNYPKALGAQAIKSMRKAVRRARRTARLHGIPIHIWRDGRVVIDRT